MREDVFEIACDESGYEGDRLVGGVTDVFTHAGVHLSSADAAAGVAELRRVIRSPAEEYKANHLLRDKHRAALLWFLGVAGPVHGHAHVWVVDKTRHLLGLADRSGDDPAAVNEELRLRHDPGLDLLVPAITLAVEHWSEHLGGPVAVVHDRQTALTPDRLDRLRAACGPRLARLDLVASRDDPRVQMADFLAGIAYRTVARARAGQVDEPVLELLLPYQLGRLGYEDVGNG